MINDKGDIGPGLDLNLSKLKILYIEDDILIRELVYSPLQKMVKEIYQSGNGIEGLELFKIFKPDLVITDIRIPGMNGLELSKKILEINPAVHIILMTAYSDLDFVNEAALSGIIHYLVKPVSLDELFDSIKKCLYGRS